jgi:predicted aspartyl protease
MGGESGIALEGSVVACRLTVSRAQAASMRMRGVEPEHTVVRLLIDTGACISALPASYLRIVGARPLRPQELYSVNHEKFDAMVYSAAVQIWGMRDGERSLQTFAADFAGIREAPEHRNHDGVLGREFLRRVHFLYDGVMGEFGLSTDLCP